MKHRGLYQSALLFLSIFLLMGSFGYAFGESVESRASDTSIPVVNELPPANPQGKPSGALRKKVGAQDQAGAPTDGTVSQSSLQNPMFYIVIGGSILAFVALAGMIVMVIKNRRARSHETRHHHGHDIYAYSSRSQGKSVRQSGSLSRSLGNEYDEHSPVYSCQTSRVDSDDTLYAQTALPQKKQPDGMDQANLITELQTQIRLIERQLITYGQRVATGSNLESLFNNLQSRLANLEQKQLPEMEANIQRAFATVKTQYDEKFAQLLLRCDELERKVIPIHEARQGKWVKLVDSLSSHYQNKHNSLKSLVGEKILVFFQVMSQTAENIHYPSLGAAAQKSLHWMHEQPAFAVMGKIQRQHYEIGKALDVLTRIRGEIIASQGERFTLQDEAQIKALAEQCKTMEQLEQPPAEEIVRMLPEIQQLFLNELNRVYQDAVNNHADPELLASMAKLLEAMGLFMIDIKIGRTPLDMRLHELISTSHDDRYQANTILNVIGMGLIDRSTREVIKKAEVIVNS